MRLDLPYRAPYDWDALVGFLAMRAITGVEVVSPERLREGTIGDRRRPRPADGGAVALLKPDRAVGDHPLPAAGRAAGGHRPGAAPVRPHRRSGRHRRASQRRSRARARSGWPGRSLRVPGAWDGFELAVRAILGQQISSSRRRLCLAGAHRPRMGGDPLRPRPSPALSPASPTSSPSAERMAAADLSVLVIDAPRSARPPSETLAVAVVRRPDLVRRPGRPRRGDRARLKALPGIGEWTAQYIAMRQLARARRLSRSARHRPAARHGRRRRRPATDNPGVAGQGRSLEAVARLRRAPSVDGRGHRRSARPGRHAEEALPKEFR